MAQKTKATWPVKWVMSCTVWLRGVTTLSTLLSYQGLRFLHSVHNHPAFHPTQIVCPVPALILLLLWGWQGGWLMQSALEGRMRHDREAGVREWLDQLWSVRSIIYLSASLPVCLLPCLPPCLSVYLWVIVGCSVHVCIYIHVCMCVCARVCPCIHVKIRRWHQKLSLLFTLFLEVESLIEPRLSGMGGLA